MTAAAIEAAERVIGNLMDAVNRGQSTILSPEDTANVVTIMAVAVQFMRRGDALDKYARSVQETQARAEDCAREIMSALTLLRAEREKADADDRRSIISHVVLIAALGAMFWLLGRVLP